jgi:hypothetical protein
MKHSVQKYLVYKRDNLQRMLISQRDIISQNAGPDVQVDRERFPRSHTMRFLCSTKSLLLAEMLFEKLICSRPRTSALFKMLVPLIVNNSKSKR